MKLIALMIAASGVVHSSPKDFFGTDYAAALQRMEKDRQEIHTITQQYGVDERTVCAMVFPEYLRYSYLSGLLETASLELMYVQLGTKAVDFSIGNFQMKPSFVETLEENLGVDERLMDKYQRLLLMVSLESTNRKMRLKRLGTIAGQTTYACAFIEICRKKFDLDKLSDDEQLQYLSAIYNQGLQHDKTVIETNMNRRTFPHGAKYKGEQFAYWEVAMDYYLKHRNHEKS